MSDQARDVLDFIDWVDELAWWGEIRSRLDECDRWQSDMSFDEIAACLGEPAPMLAPGDIYADELGTAQLYWPAIRPTAAASSRAPARDGRPSETATVAP